MAEQVTLKRADFYAKKALKEATDSRYVTHLSLSVYSPSLATTDDASRVEAEVARESKKLLEKHQLAMDLIAANFAIRQLLSVANGESGITLRLNRNACLAAEETRLRALLKAIEEDDGDKSLDVETAFAKASSLRENPKDTRRGLYGVEDVVRISVLSDAVVEDLRKQIKRASDERSIINDELTALNVSRKIVLDDVTVATLRRADIISA